MNNIKPARGLNEPPQISKIAWTTTPVAYDCTLNGPGGNASPVNGQCCRWVSCTTAGNINYVIWDGTNTGSIAAVAGFLYPCPASSLLASSSAQGVTVFW